MKHAPTPLNCSPAHLWIGPPSTLLRTAKLYAQHMFCPANNCHNRCSICSLIAAKKFYGVSWLAPERTYTIEQIRTIIQRTILSLDPLERHLFVMQDAHALNLASANCLLKVLEEPPHGYHFLLLTPYPQMLPATIRSRCLISELCGTNDEPVHALFKALSPPELYTPQQYNALLTKELPLERDITSVIEQLLKIWTTYAQTHKKVFPLNSHTMDDIQSIFLCALAQPPATGSSKLFWKQIYMHMHYAITSKKQ